MTINRTATIGAIALNIPTLLAAALLPAAATAAMAVALALLGAALGAVVGWSMQTHHQLIELPLPAELEQAA